jgi:glycosyltransferase involved in cell wall biosynthesis
MLSVDSTATSAIGSEIPQFDLHQLAPKRSRYCICVFVLNEGERISRQLQRMRPWMEKVDVIVADGGSDDGATDPQRLKEAGVTALLVKRSPGRLGTQMRIAFAHALQAGYEGVLTIDGNDKDDPSGIARFVEALEAGFDHVQGSRFIAGGQSVRCPISRYWGIRLIHAPLISLAAGWRYTDTTNGFRAYSRRLLEDSRIQLFRDVFAGYELHYYLAIRSARLGLRVKEVPVTRAYPAKGPTPTKISPVRGNLKVIGCLLATCWGRYNPKPSAG